jgi:hypothetical protein
MRLKIAVSLVRFRPWAPFPSLATHINALLFASVHCAAAEP